MLTICCSLGYIYTYCHFPALFFHKFPTLYKILVKIKKDNVNEGKISMILYIYLIVWHFCTFDIFLIFQQYVKYVIAESVDSLFDIINPSKFPHGKELVSRLSSSFPGNVPKHEMNWKTESKSEHVFSSSTSFWRFKNLRAFFLISFFSKRTYLLCELS